MKSTFYTLHFYTIKKIGTKRVFIIYPIIYIILYYIYNGIITYLITFLTP